MTGFLEVDGGVTTAQGKTYEDDAGRHAVEHPGKSPTKDSFVNFMREEAREKKALKKAKEDADRV